MATTATDLESRLKVLEARMLELEDERAIRELLSRYGYTADVKKDEEYIRLYTEDGAMDLGNMIRDPKGTQKEGLRRWENREGIRRFIKDPTGHHLPEAYGNRMHVQGNNVVCHIKGNDAIVNSYSIVLLRKGSDVTLSSGGNNQWTLKKINGKWYIKERRRRMIGGQGYHENLNATPD